MIQRRFLLAFLLAAFAPQLACGDDDGSAGPADAAPADASPDDILTRLNAIPGLHAIEPPPPMPPARPIPPGYRFFFIDFDQPVDHAHPEGAHFTQRLRLLHRDEHAPMVQHTGGYYVSSRPFRHELTKMTGGNQITIEHRYFTPSRPEPADWSFLTIEQAAEDFHAINRALHTIYDGTWVSAGESKGGMTSLFNRRFFPDDVDATVAYVAPIMTAANDPRFGPFIAQVGDDAACRQALADFQRAALTARSELLALVDADATQAGWTFDLLGEQRAFEHAVLELPFYFWQYGDASHCAEIPAAGAPTADLYAFLDAVSSMGNVSDDSVLAFTPYYFQAGTQFGWPGFPEAHIADLMSFDGSDVPATYATSTGVTLTYDPQPMGDILDWLATSGQRIIFIYGQNDPWSAAMVDPTGAQDSFRFIQPAGNHGSKILALPAAEQKQAMDALSGWLGVTLTIPADPSAPRLVPGVDYEPEYDPHAQRTPL